LHSTTDAEKRTGVPYVPSDRGSATGACCPIRTGEVYSF
jgi:hypothetical protein